MFKQYIISAIRSFARQKTYFFINFIGLTIGLTSCLLISFYVIDELSYDRFHERGDRIYRVTYNMKLPNGEMSNFAVTEYRLREAFMNFYSKDKELIRIGQRQAYFIEKDDNKYFERRVGMVEKNMFDVFSFKWLKGDKNGALDEPYTAVITESIAKKYFGDKNPINQTLKLKASEELDIRITGVIQDMPRNSHFHLDIMISMETAPILLTKMELEYWGHMSLYSYILLEEGESIENLRHSSSDFIESIWGEKMEGELIYQPLFDIHLKSHKAHEYEVNGDAENVVVFSIISFFILFIATINYMNLSTARSAKRSLEVGVRKVFGAPRKSLIIQFLSESIIITFIALILSTALADLLMPRFNHIANKEISIEWMNNIWIFAFLIIIAAAVGVMSGSYPAFLLSSFKPLKVLKESARISGTKSFLRKILVISQFSVSIVLIICTLVIYQQWIYMRNKSLGVDPDNVLILSNPGTKHFNTLKSELLKNPNILNVTASNNRPTTRISHNLSFEAEGVDQKEISSIQIVAVEYDFFETFNNEILQGRSFDRKYSEDEQATFVLNEAAVKLFGWDNPIGKYFETVTIDFDTFEWLPRKGRIVGVAEDFYFESVYDEVAPVVYFIDHNWINWVSIKLDGNNIPETVNYINSLWNDLNEGNINYKAGFYKDDIDALYKTEERFFQLFILFSGLAIVIASLGIFGLASFTAEQRTKEIGVRKVLGASVSSIVRIVNKEFIRLVFIANLIAWPAAWYFMKNWLDNFVFRVDLSLWVFIVSAFIAILIALITVSFQAFKAARTHPVVALRYE